MDPALLFMVVIYCPCVEDMVHVANVLYLISYLVRDILWLRVLTIFAGLSLLPFYCHCSDHVLWAPIGWNALFISVNLIQIGILLRERRPRRLDGPEQELYDNVFSELTPGEFRQLLKVGEWREIETGTTVVQRDTVVRDIQVLQRGALEVRSAGGVIDRDTPGQFVGEMSFLSGEKATADVVAIEPSLVFVWPQESLNKLLDKKPALAFKIRGILSLDVVAKLRNHGQPVR